MRERLAQIDRVIAQGPYSADWASLSGYRVPEWYRNAKFGIFIHWGVYSVPAYDCEWYPRNMYMADSKAYEHHIATYGPHKTFGYKDLVPLFRAERFDPDAWAALFQRAGARYVVPVAEHHDGFQMYKSDISHCNAFEMGPKRDVLGELKASCEARGLAVGASSHRIEHWFFMGHGRDFDSDVREPLARGDLYWPAMPEGDFQDLYSQPAPSDAFMQDWLLRTCELIDRYRPRVLYFDWWIQHSAAKPWIKKLAAYYYNRAAEWGAEVVSTYKHDAFLFGAAVPDVEPVSSLRYRASSSGFTVTEPEEVSLPSSISPGVTWPARAIAAQALSSVSDPLVIAATAGVLPAVSSLKVPPVGM